MATTRAAWRWLRSPGRVRQSSGVWVWLTEKAHMSRAQIILAAAMLLAYGIGYPLALVGHSPSGWLLVTLGGVFLIVLGIITVRRIHNSSSDT